jgi:hypothetical protein
MIIVAGLLHYWIRAMRKSSQAQAQAMDDSAGTGSHDNNDEHAAAR